MLAVALAPGHTIFEAGDRKSALLLLRENPDIQVALVDLGLPPFEHTPEEGLALLHAVRLEGMPVKLIVLTGQDQESAALAAIEAGAFDFLSKPASIPAIQASLSRAELFARKERELSGQGIARITISAPLGEGLRNVRDEAEERLVRQVLQDTAFNIHESARRLGVKRENIYYFLKKFGIVREGKTAE